MKRINIDFVKKVLLIFFVCILLFVASFSRPYKVQALPIAAIALGSGALGAVVAAYFATAGVQLSGSGDADGNFLGNYVANWVKSSSSFPNNGYFNSDGEFVGNNSDLSIVQNEDTGLVSFIFGKEFAMWLEAVKQSFVSEKNLTTSSSTISTTRQITDLNGNTYSIFQATSSYKINGYTYPAIPDSPILINKGVTIIPINSSSAVRITSPYSNNQGQVFIESGSYNNNHFSRVYSTTVNLGYPFTGSDYSTRNFALFFILPNSSEVQFGIFNYGSTSSTSLNFLSSVTIPNANAVDIENISLDGSLTDGYQDFEDAINNDLTNADEDEVAVVDVGTFPDVLDPTLLVPDILDRAVVGELNPTYDGTRENTESAEEEKEGNKPFVPQYPSDWVVIEGIQSFFPFCIPWDLAYIIGLLQADPVAPNFTWVMDFGKYADPYTIHIDLAPFETVAIVFRTMIVFLFVFFLIKKSRDLIRG